MLDYAVMPLSQRHNTPFGHGETFLKRSDFDGSGIDWNIWLVSRTTRCTCFYRRLGYTHADTKIEVGEPFRHTIREFNIIAKNKIGEHHLDLVGREEAPGASVSTETKL